MYWGPSFNDRWNSVFRGKLASASLKRNFGGGEEGGEVEVVFRGKLASASLKPDLNPYVVNLHRAIVFRGKLASASLKRAKGMPIAY